MNREEKLIARKNKAEKELAEIQAKKDEEARMEAKRVREEKHKAQIKEIERQMYYTDKEPVERLFKFLRDYNRSPIPENFIKEHLHGYKIGKLLDALNQLNELEESD